MPSVLLLDWLYPQLSVLFSKPLIHPGLACQAFFLLLSHLFLPPPTLYLSVCHPKVPTKTPLLGLLSTPQTQTHTQHLTCPELSWGSYVFRHLLQNHLACPVTIWIPWAHHVPIKLEFPVVGCGAFIF